MSGEISSDQAETLGAGEASRDCATAVGARDVSRDLIGSLGAGLGLAMKGFISGYITVGSKGVDEIEW